MTLDQDLSASLLQRGRASVDFMAHLFRGSQTLRADVDATLSTISGHGAELPEDLDERDLVLHSALQRSPSYRSSELLGEWIALNHGRVAADAFEEIRERIESQLLELDRGRVILELKPDFEPPDYWRGVNFHRTTGGWEGHAYQGYIHGILVHRKMVLAMAPGNILKQRREIAAMAPHGHYDRILELGCGTGLFTLALSEVYPDAELHAVDLSRRLLEHTRRVGNARTCAWTLWQRPAESTGFDDDGFDLVTSFILLHELPADTVAAVFREAFRVTRPGGDLLMSDVARYADLDKLAEWKADRSARFGGEPHWRGSARLDLGQVAEAAGFEQVRAEAVGPNGYPYVVMARKPI